MVSKVLVIGAGISGEGVSRLLASSKQYEVYLCDKKEIKNKKELLELGIKCLYQDEVNFLLDFKFVVKSPGIPYHNDFIKKIVDLKIPIFTDIEIAYWFSKENFIYGAITGTNGKTTTTCLLYELLQEKKALLAGNVGISLCDQVLEHQKEESMVALELSNFQLLGIDQFKPKVATILNLTPDHLDYMLSVEAYYESKTKIFKNQTQEDFFIVNIDEDTLQKYIKNCNATLISVSYHNQKAKYYYDGEWIMNNGQKWIDTTNCSLVGKHNKMNIIVACVMASYMGITKRYIQEKIIEFKAIKHRLELVAEINGVFYYNDSKATNPDSTSKALESFDNNIILIAGGYDKKISFDYLAKYNNKIKCCIGYGQVKNEIIKPFYNSMLCDNLQQGVEYANKIAKKGDIVLFSPACASYDQYRNYEERGDHFCQLIENFKKKLKK